VAKAGLIRRRRHEHCQFLAAQGHAGRLKRWDSGVKQAEGGRDAALRRHRPVWAGRNSPHYIIGSFVGSGLLRLDGGTAQRAVPTKAML
jgi:hypothetical protein